VTTGKPGVRITEVAREIGADLIIVGAHHPYGGGLLHGLDRLARGPPGAVLGPDPALTDTGPGDPARGKHLSAPAVPETAREPPGRDISAPGQGDGTALERSAL
jgi:hypothetical protein